MYLPNHFAEERSDVLQGFLREQPLGLVIAHGAAGLTADPIPFVFDPKAGEQGTLLGHVARNNPLWRDRDGVSEALVVFQGSSAYISPTWYETKQLTHEVVPTYNYLMVQVRGPLIVHDEYKWVRMQAGLLTNQFEGDREPRWKMGDAPQEYLTGMLSSIVGIEIPVRSMTGKWKLGQNRVEADREGAIAGLLESGEPESTAIAEAMERALVEDR